MDVKELSCRLSGRISQEEAVNLSFEVSAMQCWGVLHDLICSDDKRVRQNAAWVATWLMDEELAALAVYKDMYIRMVMTTKDNTLRRLLLGVIRRMRLDVDGMDARFFDFCLQGIVSAAMPAASQVLCMKIAYDMVRQCPELGNEFFMVMDMMEPSHYTAAVLSVRKKIMNDRK